MFASVVEEERDGSIINNNESVKNFEKTASYTCNTHISNSIIIKIKKKLKFVSGPV